MDLRLVTRPRVGLSHVAALLAGFAFYANSLVTAQLVQAPEATGYGLGLSIVATGLCLLPSGVTMLLFSPVSARISAARGPRITLALGAAVIACGYAVRIADSRDLWMIIGRATVSRSAPRSPTRPCPPSSCGPCPPSRPPPPTASTS